MEHFFRANLKAELRILSGQAIRLLRFTPARLNAATARNDDGPIPDQEASREPIWP
jgi:hypothetical protein